MSNSINYEYIIEAVQLDLDEYVDEDGLTVTQASGKIIEEDWQNINTNDFIKYSYLVNLALEGIKRKQLPDFLYEKLSYAEEAISKIENNESEELKKDFNIYQDNLKQKSFNFIETSASDKSRIDYILNQKQ
ncbi:MULTISPECIES: hypothetical protein [Bacillus]|uniref:hypothetical protein n=1 Tax=Bacillus TaxID=1386 RepID=UPI000993B094|nr:MULTISPECIES: hypothetical protein [Bacillus cereus group]PEW98666.1 hypothetical protein CN446_08150 [Bacillus cereus]MCD4643447.1 hypothetical protein [Bacillus mycoides]MED1436336.1 hypothetical protein [Bacillus mycoides]MED1511774.1 hypothetical protein [Bacillus proteolyticus]MED1625424.1 hypothetical protein [Bacillus mycoides]